MLKTIFMKNLPTLMIIISIFLIDRFSKIYILKLSELQNGLDIYLNPFLNLYLIWNKGIAFGLLSSNQDTTYNIITFLIAIIIIVILYEAIKSQGFKKYSLLLVLSGALGNIFDRIYYSAVPDFIDLHIKNFHWFIFNIADIFITLGVLCLIYEELFFNKIKDEKKN
ncbi:signal peptidase II [Candidatus Pelagibacter sp.]|nr:signal peptidase II [Candidatus Pelagibacter sp.]